jgi:chemotaxis protein CheD
MTLVDTLEALTLGPGDLAIGTRGDRLETLLGSCVSIILTDPRRTVGVMCHFMHCKPAPTMAENPTAYADAAWHEMQRLLVERGITPHLCEAYVYGGGDMFPGLELTCNVGDNNVRWALRALAEAGIPIRGSDLGGSVYRKVSWQVGAQTPTVISVSMQAPP